MTAFCHFAFTLATYSLFYSLFSLEQPDWSGLNARQVMPLLCSNLLLPFSPRVKARIPRWFFKVLPKLAGHSPGVSPTIPAAHSTLASESLYSSSMLSIPYWFPCWRLVLYSHRPQGTHGMPLCPSDFHSNVTQLGLSYLKVATLILKLSSLHPFIFLLSYLIHYVYFYLSVYCLSDEHRHFYLLCSLTGLRPVEKCLAHRIHSIICCITSWIKEW